MSGKSSQKLDHLEQTITEIVVELIMLDQEKRYPDLLFGDADDIKSVRISMHYVMALLAYGFTTDEAELEKALHWFNKTFPKQKPDFIEVIEMNRLMVLLNLDPTNKYVTKRLQQLAKQKSSNYFDVQPGWHEFDTLWTLEAFALAREQGVLTNDIISIDDIRSNLNQLLSTKELKRDKDVALALRLQYELFGKLDPNHEETLRELIDMAKGNKGMWGMREFRWRMENVHWYQELLNGHPLTYTDVQSDRQIFRKVIISTCMVIENLLPLVATYPELEAPIRNALHLWWAQFQGQTAVATLRNLFPNPYDYVLVMSRTLRAIRKYIGHPLLGLESTHLIRRITQLQTQINEPVEIRNVRAALRQWIQVDLAGPIERLKLGFSEADVIRVQPFVWSPLTNDEERPRSLIPYSLIIKYGPSEMIDSERKSYEALPAATKDCFVNIPEASFTDRDMGLSYVIMQDLRDYRTLYEIHEELTQNISTIGNSLSSFLKHMHEGGSITRQKGPSSLLREVYLSRMMEYIDRIFNFIFETHLYKDDEEIGIRAIQHELFDRIGQIIQNQRRLETFPAAHMHGDLHLRNIMVYGLGQSRRSTQLRFKLIDLEFMRMDGDAAFDAGQLLIDIDLVSREEHRIDSEEELIQLKRILEENYLAFGKQLNDDTFALRMELAKARALLRIAKGKAKRGAHFIKNNQTAQAGQIAKELIAHTHEALEFLRIVVEDMPR